MSRSTLVALAGLALVAQTARGERSEIFVPDGDGPFPGVVVLGSYIGGDAARDWATWLAERGHAALLVGDRDPAGERGQDAEPDGGAVQRARRQLGADPRVDDDRIAVLGLAEGGLRALHAAQGNGFRAAIAVDPALGDGPLRSRVPVLLLSGRDGSRGRPDRVRRVAVAARRDGQPVAYRSYPGVSHGFDAGRHVSGVHIRGRWTGYQAYATARARRDVGRFLERHLADAPTLRVAATPGPTAP